jgi:uncharacterized damage-inducible protein DinB
MSSIRLPGLKRRMASSTGSAAAARDPRYPIGTFERPASVTPEMLETALTALADLPTNLRDATKGLDPGQLNTPYREGGWTVRQLVHHVADSHMNAFCRVRLALTEEAPTIKPYDEKAWAELHDSEAPIKWSLSLIEGLHARWVMLLQSLGEAQWQRTFHHPESGATTVQMASLLYAWHSRHHTAHITHLRMRMDW